MSHTIYDIAREAGVSIATVSRVFNKDDRVTGKTREKVLAVADRLGYHPRALARSLAKKSTKTITVIVPVISNYFFMEVLAGLQDRIADYNYDLQIINVKGNDDLFDQTRNIIKSGWGEGYLIISVHLPDHDWDTLGKFRMPVVLIDEYYPGFETISVDSIEGAYTATGHLIRKGCSRPGILCANPDSKPGFDRMLGFRRAMEDAGIMVERRYVSSGRDRERDGFNENNGYEAMSYLLELENPPDGCFCASDIQALGAMKAMKDRGRHMPVIGFDDLEISEYIGLSTMRQPMYEMGTLAIDKIVNRIENPDIEVTHTVFSPELILRSTTPGYAGVPGPDGK